MSHANLGRFLAAFNERLLVEMGIDQAHYHQTLAAMGEFAEIVGGQVTTFEQIEHASPLYKFLLICCVCILLLELVVPCTPSTKRTRICILHLQAYNRGIRWCTDSSCFRFHLLTMRTCMQAHTQDRR